MVFLLHIGGVFHVKFLVSIFCGFIVIIIIILLLLTQLLRFLFSQEKWYQSPGWSTCVSNGRDYKPHDYS